MMRRAKKWSKAEKIVLLGAFFCLSLVATLSWSNSEIATVLSLSEAIDSENNGSGEDEFLDIGNLPPRLSMMQPMSPMEEYQKKLERQHQIEVAKHEKKSEKKGLPIKFLPPLPYFGGDVVFSGHLVPDADSIASSLAGAFLFNGTAMYMGNLNTETKFLLHHFGAQHFPLLRLTEHYNGQHFVIVDHNAYEQRPKIFNASKIMGILDHHALSQEPTIVPQPVYIDIRPWGSCSTVLATKFLEHDAWIPPPLAGVLLGGLLSDTLNLKSPTATLWDRKVRFWLALRAFWRNPSTGKEVLGSKLSPKILESLINELAHEQFKAKANTTGLSLKDIVLSDFKRYNLKRIRKDRDQRKQEPQEVMIGWATIESVSPFFDAYRIPIQLRNLIQNVMPIIRKERSLMFLFVSLIDIETEKSYVICGTTEECALLREAFPDLLTKSIPGTDGMQMKTTPRVSRKDEFLPPIRKALIGLSR